MIKSAPGASAAGGGGAFAAVAVSYQAPTTGFAITPAAGIGVLGLEPAGTLASGTITMPAAPVDNQTLEVTTTQSITALTVSANAGQSILNAPTSMTLGVGFSFRYRASNTTWYRRY